MNTSWWLSQNDLDNDQKNFILLPVTGKHLLVGPPGSGKTNLLLLRAQFIAGSGEKNVLIVTFTKGLVDFIRSGIGTQGLIQPDQVKTFHSWAFEHIRDHLNERALTKEADFDEEARANILQLLIKANKQLPTQKLYSAIFVDEAQDFTEQELASLLCLSDNVCICGDKRQGIYQKDGLNIAGTFGMTSHVLKNHFRIGHRIAHVADRLIKPATGESSLESTSNYNKKLHGESTAKMHPCNDRNDQFNRMVELIRVQLVAFKGDTIGIFCGKRDTLAELKEKFSGTDLADLVCVHGIDENASFSDIRPIHVITIHSAKGTEFRAVHIYGAEELKGFGLNKRTLGYTAITRAKTALNVFRTGETNTPLEEAFAEPKHLDIAELFPSGA